jgi:hypothetical protein
MIVQYAFFLPKSSDNTSEKTVGQFCSRCRRAVSSLGLQLLCAFTAAYCFPRENNPRNIDVNELAAARQISFGAVTLTTHEQVSSAVYRLPVSDQLKTNR